MQFRMLRHMRLDEHGATLWIKPGCQPVQQYFQRILFYLRGVCVIRGKSVPVGHEEEALVLVLHADPVVQRAHEIPQMELSRGPHAAQNPFPLISRSHHAFRRTHSNILSTGPRTVFRKLPPK